MNKNQENWDLVIEPQGSLLNLGIKELLRYKDLLEMFVRRDIVTLYKQTVLGPLWYVIQPLFTTIMFMFVFGNIAGIPTDGIPQPLFYMAGILCWNYFSECLIRTSDTFLTNQNIFGKVYFPRMIVPLSVTISSLLKFLIQLALFIVLYIYFFATGKHVSPNMYAFLFPLLLLMLAGLGLGFGILFSAMTTKYRDLKFLLAFGVQLWMYATPIIYPLSIMERQYSKYMWIISYNPVTPIIETFKYGFLGEGIFSWGSLTYSFIFTIAILLTGTIVFNKIERNFMDVV
jgi:lipopolysaccharide transport system permease protein